MDKPEKNKKMSDSLKMNTTTQKLMEDLQSYIPKIPGFNVPNLNSYELRESNVPLTPPTLEKANGYQSASVFIKALLEEASRWKAKLPKNYKAAILAILYGGIQIHVQSLAKVSFHGIRITGLLKNSPCSILAHQSTIQMICYPEEKTEETIKNPIGFIWDNNNIEV